MDLVKLAETVLLNMECFWVLQELDEAYGSEDVSAGTFLQNRYIRRPVEYCDIHPLIRINTTLALLILPVSFLNRFSGDDLRQTGFRIREEYQIVYRRNGEPSAIIADGDVLTVVRNALAHLPDFACGGCEANIAFDDGILRCHSDRRGGEDVVFESEDGFVSFVTDLMSSCRSAASSIIEAAASPDE